MDLKVYYRKIREIEADIPESDVVVVSYETPEGGRPGVMTEVQKRQAAKLVVEGKARLASKDESTAYRRELLEAYRKEQERLAANQVKFAIVSDSAVGPSRTTRSRKQQPAKD